MVNSPLIRPAISWGAPLWGGYRGTLDSHDYFGVEVQGSPPQNTFGSLKQRRREEFFFAIGSMGRLVSLPTSN